MDPSSNGQWRQTPDLRFRRCAESDVPLSAHPADAPVGQRTGRRLDRSRKNDWGPGAPAHPANDIRRRPTTGRHHEAIPLDLGETHDPGRTSAHSLDRAAIREPLVGTIARRFSPVHGRHAVDLSTEPVAIADAHQRKHRLATLVPLAVGWPQKLLSSARSRLGADPLGRGRALGLSPPDPVEERPPLRRRRGSRTPLWSPGAGSNSGTLRLEPDRRDVSLGNPTVGRGPSSQLPLARGRHVTSGLARAGLQSHLTRLTTGDTRARATRPWARALVRAFRSRDGARLGFASSRVRAPFDRRRRRRPTETKSPRPGPRGCRGYE